MQTPRSRFSADSRARNRSRIVGKNRSKVNMSEDHGSFGSYSVCDTSKAPYLLPSAAEMVSLDSETIKRGVSARELMDRAGGAIADRIATLYSNIKNVVVLCGPGNNGGDGLVIAKSLKARGISVDVIVVSADRYSSECQAQIYGLEKISVFGGALSLSGSKAVVAPITPPEVRTSLLQADLVVDALLGSGQRAAPRGHISELLEVVLSARKNGFSAKIISVDMPTGIDSDTGALFTPHIVADRTFAVQLIKRGCLHFPARAACGEIECVDIGISGDTPVEYTLVGRSNLPRLPARPADTHKGALGRVLVIGGSLAMPGAPMLSALGSLKSGAGIVSRVVRSGWSTIPPLPEAMFVVLGGDAPTYQLSDLSQLTEIIKRYDVCVLGPGMGTEAGTLELFVSLIDFIRVRGTRVIIDADALNLLSQTKISLAGMAAVITPHPGEAARLLGVGSDDIQRDRFVAAADLARKIDAITVLKGAGTLIHDGICGRLVAEGTPYLATPGSGDVLAGVIAGCAARCASLWEAAILGVWLHAKAGAAAARKSGGPILASEIADFLGCYVGAAER